MKRSLILKRGLQIFLVLIGVALLTFAWVDRELKSGRGGSTEVIDLQQFQTDYTSLLIRNVNILSPDCSHFIPHQQVILENGIITSILPDTVIQEDFPILDAQGKYLIPGLVDSHIHLRESKNDLYLYLANGITYVREMTGTTTHLKWKKEIMEGALGPRMYVASEKVNSKQGFAALFETWTRARINYATDQAAKEKIEELQELGFDAIKMGSFINAEMYHATLKHAHAVNLPVVGHIPFSVGLDEMLKTDQDEIAHVEEITKSKMWAFGGYHADNAQEFLDHIEQDSDDIAQKIRDKNIPVVTTLWLMESLPQQKFNMSSFIKTVPLSYTNPAIVEGTKLYKGWLPGHNHYEEPVEVMESPEKRQDTKIFWETYAKAIQIMTRALARNGVTILAGTDTNIPFTVPGFSFHSELVSMANVGMSTAQVLRSATIDPGKFMKSQTGIIQEGYLADLVLLAQNPLEDIRNTTSIEHVFCGKHWLKKEQLKQMLASVKRVNEEARNVDISEFLE